ncbi:MAG: DinB family protein [Actinomycetota bacterium]
MTLPSLTNLLEEYDRALDYSEQLTGDLTEAEIHWRPSPESSGIGWHLGHQAAVAHYLVRNLTAAEPEIDPELDRLMDSATAERDRGDLPTLDRLRTYRTTVADRVRFRVGAIDEGNVGAPNQLRMIAGTLLIAAINHEYQHSKWIGEVRSDVHGKAVPPDPVSERLAVVDGYLVLAP